MGCPLLKLLLQNLKRGQAPPRDVESMEEEEKELCFDPV